MAGSNTSSKPKPASKPVGRPLFDGKPEHAVVQKLEQAFAIGASDNEACAYAEISRAAFYEYQKKHPEFLDRKDRLKEQPILRARQTVVKALEVDPNLAFKFLERKRKKEFGQNLDITSDGKGFFE